MLHDTIRKVASWFDRKITQFHHNHDGVHGSVVLLASLISVATRPSNLHNWAIRYRIYTRDGIINFSFIAYISTVESSTLALRSAPSSCVEPPNDATYCTATGTEVEGTHAFVA